MMNLSFSGPRPWFYPEPIKIDEDLLKKNPLDRIPKIDPNWKLTEENQNIRALTKEESEAFWRKQNLAARMTSINADAGNLSEEQQWTLVETMASIRSSLEKLTNNILMAREHKICGAIYGQNLAKIEFASRILGSEYTEKLKDALGWYADRTILDPNYLFMMQIHPEYPDYKKFVRVFQQVGDFKGTGSGEGSVKQPRTELRLYAEVNQDALKFKSSLKESLDQLSSSFDKPLKGYFDYLNSFGGDDDYKSIFINDWDKYFSNLISHNAGSDNLSAYIHKYDLTA